MTYIEYRHAGQRARQLGIVPVTHAQAERGFRFPTNARLIAYQQSYEHRQFLFKLEWKYFRVVVRPGEVIPYVNLFGVGHGPTVEEAIALLDGANNVEPVKKKIRQMEID